MEQSPWVDHSWGVTLYVTSRGLTSSPIPHGTRIFEIEFDFIEHELAIRSSDGGTGQIPLRPQSVAAFYRELMGEMDRLDLHVKVDPIANEIQDTVRLDQDESHGSYDPEYANRFWRILVQADRVFKEFRSRFIGKCSLVHYFWGGPDLAVTRFSGRTAPPHPGGVPHLPDRVAREAYSHEVSSAGFWPGGGSIPYPVFYSYGYPEPAGFRDATLKPDTAFYSQDLREFVLPYEAVRQAGNPDETLLDFLQTTYEAAAIHGNWDRDALERPAGWHV